MLLDVNAELYFDATSSTTTARAPLHLPQGATITGLTVNAFDNVVANASVFLRVYNIAGRTIATFGTATTSGTPGYTTVTPVVSTAVVDNTANTYYIVFSLPNAANGNSLTLQTARVTYTVTQAD